MALLPQFSIKIRLELDKLKVYFNSKKWIKCRRIIKVYLTMKLNILKNQTLLYITMKNLIL